MSGSLKDNGPETVWTAVFLRERGGVRGYIEELLDTTAWAGTIEECRKLLLEELRITLAANRWETWYWARKFRVVKVAPLVVEIPVDVEESDEMSDEERAKLEAEAEVTCGNATRLFGGRTCELSITHTKMQRPIIHRSGSITWIEVSPEQGDVGEWVED